MAKLIGFVPARSGSKGIRDKNLLELNGKTLIELAVEVGLFSELEDVYISTDSPIYETVAIGAGAKSFGLRPANLATDSAKTIDVIIEWLGNFKSLPDIIVVLQPTAPCRTPQQINEALRILSADHDCDAIVTLQKHEEPHPHKLKLIESDGIVIPFIAGTSSETPRQLLPTVFRLTGCLYAIRVSELLTSKTLLPLRTKPLLTEHTPNINIDSELDYLTLAKDFQ